MQRTAGTFIAVLLVAGCGGGGRGGTGGASGAGGAAGTTGTGGSVGTAGTIGTGGTSGAAGSVVTGGTSGAAGSGGSGAGGSGGICQTARIQYEPKISTAYLVVDRSTSMFHCLTTSAAVCPDKADTSWSTLKNAVEAVVTQLDSQVRFGFTTKIGRASCRERV